jgi:NAD(P)-dependent dehydrogenase (short-subunit alcohol dehydrogenase family)
MKRFHNRTVIITGGAREMGASFARGFVAHGAKVVIADVLEQEGWGLVAELADHAIFSRLQVMLLEPCFRHEFLRASEFSRRTALPVREHRGYARRISDKPEEVPWHGSRVRSRL